MKTHASRSLLAFGFLLVSFLVAQDLPVDPEVVHPFQRITVPNLTNVTAPNSSEPAVAKAGLAIILSASKLKCDPDSQVESVADSIAGESLKTLVTKISGASCLVDGRMLRVAASFVPNGMIQANTIVASIKENKPLLIEWKGALYVLYGVVYDEHLHNSGRQDNVIRELLLIDPRHSDKRRFITFKRDRDDFGAVEGVASISVSQ